MDNSLRIFTGDFAKRLPDEALKLDVLPVMVFPENVQLRRILIPIGFSSDSDSIEDRKSVV